MASELTVQTIKGPTSGGNANKIIIPSGQTLDASAGVLTPSAGQVVQQVEFFNNVTFTTQSTSYVTTPCTVSITPKFVNSKMNIYICGGVYTTHTTEYRGGLRKNGSVMSGFSSDDLPLYHANANSNAEEGGMIAQVFTDPNVGTLSSVTYAYYVKRSGSNSATVYFYRNYGIIVQEIKQ